MRSTPKSQLHQAGAAGEAAPGFAAELVHAQDSVASRFDLKYGTGGLSHAALMKNIELYGTQVIPTVRQMAADASGRVK
jgi:hypothetical protein